MADEDGQREPEGLQDLQLQDGLLARGRQDEGAAGSSRKMDGAQSRQKARERKAEALGMQGL